MSTVISKNSSATQGSSELDKASLGCSGDLQQRHPEEGLVPGQPGALCGRCGRRGALPDLGDVGDVGGVGESAGR